MQLTKMFASLGFKVDPTGAQVFESNIRQMRTSAAKFGRSLGQVSDRLDRVIKKAKDLNTSMKNSFKVSSKGTTNQYKKLAENIARVAREQEKINTQTPSIVASLDRIRSKVWKSSNAWKEYAKNVNAAKQALRGLNVGGLGGGSRITINQRTTTNNYQGGRGGGGTGHPRPNTQGGYGQQDSASMMFLGGLQGFFRSMTPATALAGGAVSAGFALKEIVQAGREVQKMQNVIMMASGGAGSKMEHNLKFIKDTTKEMGVSYVEFGNAYAKMLSATNKSPLGTDAKETMFKDLSAYMVAIGSSADDQKGIFRALTQMFTKGKVQAEEMLQMAERGVPAAMEIRRAVVEGLGMTNEQFDKMQQKGELDPNKILPIMAANFGKLARETGAYEKASKSSAAAQQRLVNSWQVFSYAILSSGLDEGLGKLFNLLSDILDKLTPIAKGFIYTAKAIGGFSKSVGEAVSNNKLLVGGLGLALLALIRFRGATRDSSRVTRILNLNLKTLWRIFGTLIKRIGLVGLAITGLVKIFQDMNKHVNGEDNWITLIGLDLEILGLKLDIALNKWRLFWQGVRYFKNPLKAWEYANPDDNDGFFKTLYNTVFPDREDFIGKAVGKSRSQQRLNEGVGLPQGLPSKNIDVKLPIVQKLIVDIRDNGKPVSSQTYDWGNIPAVAAIQK